MEYGLAPLLYWLAENDIPLGKGIKVVISQLVWIICCQLDG